MLKKTIQYIIIGLLLSIWIFIFQNKETTREFVQENLGINRPCSQPLKYSIGDIDARFSLSQEELKILAQDAELVWENKAGKNLFEFDPASAFRINMIFDERQQQTNEADNLNSQLEGLEATHEKLINKYDNLSASYQKRLNDYNQDLKAYEKKVNEYNEDVDDWNDQGGTSEEEFEDLKDRKKELEAMYKKLDRERTELNKLANQVKNVAGEESKLVNTYNSSVNTYRIKYGSEREFEKGIFNGEAINIYEFRDLDDLRLTITHEFGHYLGLDHTTDPKSIMYPMIGEQEMENPILSDQDTSELKKVCNLY